ncbi:3-deoxy-D-manno-octulosonic acid transferase [Peijinzhouia sedimentorum]
MLLAIGIYRIALFAYYSLLRLVAIFHAKASQFVKGRKNWEQPLKQWRASTGNAPLVWFHCASLGEFEQGRPVMEAFKKTYPNYQILLTFYSPSGYEVRKNYAGADYIMYLPCDSPSNARKFMSIIQPKTVFFVKYEYWFFHLSEVAKLKLPLFSISTILRPNQLFFRWHGLLHRQCLSFFTYFFTQNQETQDLLHSLQINNCSLTGDTRFDRVIDIYNQKKAISIAESFVDEQKCIVVGSAWPQDRELLKSVIQNTNYKWIIAPHDIHEADLAEWEKAFPKQCIRYSKAGEAINAKILLVDNVGMLSSLYQYGWAAYIGGAFGAGLHNTLEAAVYGIPVFFGNKNYRKFNEAIGLIDNGAAFAVNSGKEMEGILTRFEQDPHIYQQTAEKAGGFVKENKGATSLIMNKITKWID